MTVQGSEIAVLRAAVEERPTDAEARYALGVLLLESCLMDWDPATVEEAAVALRESLELGRVSAWTYAALGYSEDITDDRAGRALQYLSKAREADPFERVFEIYALRLLVDRGAESEALSGIEAAADKHQVDLASLRDELASAGFPVTADNLLTNGFVHARNYFVSWLQNEADGVRKASTPELYRRRAEAEATRCLDDRRRLADRFDPSLVPRSCRELSTWARRLGVGDDVCRRQLFAALAEAEKDQLRRAVGVCASAAHAWLDTFGDRPLAEEAAAMMFLLLGVEEELDGDGASGTHGG